MRLNVNVSQDKYVVASLVPLVVMLVAMFVGGATAQVAFSFAAITFIALYVLIGTHSSEDRFSPRPFVALAAGLLVMLGVAFALLWYYHFQNPAYTDPTYWLGFPRATAIVVYLLWMPPALYLMFSYPYLFDRYIWSEEQAEEFREMNRVTASAEVGGEEE
ncbi:MAG: hypothetical protein RI568_13330 [Natronomonas sp.]|uniref:hypothetical protein n=1 Tax=Natronomonas sp. TaxID=2184060 RepID=UPI0028706291|nr:hypothetical protein [Natronomonas sp.]MDR9431665.1 hypothetical protein [Natronomonas sp.]